MHRRRGVGVKAVKKKAQEKESYASKAAEMEATEAAHVGAFLATFRRSLEAFAAKHKRGIREDPVFRRQFTAMCYETGVDPLRSSKGFWADALGVGDFYYEVGVKVVECCAATRGENGGLIALDDLLDRVGAQLVDADGQGRERRAVGQQVQPAGDLLDASLDVLQLLLDGDGIRDVRRVGQQAQVEALLGPQVAPAGLQVGELLADVLAGHVAVDDVACLAHGGQQVLEAADGDADGHLSLDEPLGVGGGGGPGDVATERLCTGDDLAEGGVEEAWFDL